METMPPPELEGQTSINDLLDEPVGVAPVQLALPILSQLPARGR